VDVKTAIESRRAYRSLAPVDIADATVATMAESARLAASCYNNQPWRFVFVRRRDVLERLYEALPEGNKWAIGSSMVVAVASKGDLDCRIKGRDYFLFDTGMATAHMILTATELGLVAHPIAGYSQSKVKEVLGVPDDVTVITLVIVGRRASELSPLLSDVQVEAELSRPERLPVREIAFQDAYGS
jgi:nitroreductase